MKFLRADDKDLLEKLKRGKWEIRTEKCLSLAEEIVRQKKINIFGQAFEVLRCEEDCGVITMTVKRSQEN